MAVDAGRNYVSYGLRKLYDVMQRGRTYYE